MQQDAILQPMLAMVVLTFAVWLYMYVRRIKAMRRMKIDPQRLQAPGAKDELLSRDVNFAAENFRNLFELPVLFYVLCFYLYNTQQVDAVHVFSAWWFVAFRVVHSIVQCTANRIMVRFTVYQVSSLALWVMLGRAAFQAF